MREQTQRVALVTGGSRGIGRGIAKCLAKRGMDVVISGRRRAQDAADAVAELENLGASVLYCRVDVGALDKHPAMLQAIRERFGQLDVLVNNAGVAPRSGPTCWRRRLTASTA